ncbi:hypothetical protein A0H81_09126 [Grifola frondosa]|uniref:RNA polymerase II elongation factor ELL N-terminal domain-containing protein n=1 Tax=Grifola frondosa TaxID=5627 RepID=A0A1C7M1R8_GRIFR|nr:hypothetical protein A0H81_09126 [Grifola frondosa]
MPLPVHTTLSLQGHSRPGDTLLSKPKQAMIVRMSAEALEALESFPNQPKMEFEFSDSPGIYIGDTFFSMQSLKEDSPHELYLRTSTASKPMAPLKHYANVTGKFTVVPVLNSKVEDKVRERTLKSEQQRTGRQIVVVDTPPVLNRPATSSGAKKRKEPATRKEPQILRRPAGNASASSTAHPSRVASPLPNASASTNEALENMRTRLIHFLAIRQRELKALLAWILAKSVLTEKDFLRLLNEVGELVPQPKNAKDAPETWQLKLRSWTEVRPYETSLPLTPEERTAVARSARLNFRTLGIPESDPRWQGVVYRDGDTAPTGSDERVLPSSRTTATAKNKAKEVNDIPPRPPAPRRPGSGSKANSTMGRDASPTVPPPPKRTGPVDVRDRKKEVPTPSGSAKPAPSIPPPLPNRNQKSSSTAVSKPGIQVRKKATESQAPVARTAEIEKDTKPARSSPVPTVTIKFKRKKPADDDLNSEISGRDSFENGSAQKKQKMDPDFSPDARKRAEAEIAAMKKRNLSLPAKPARTVSPLVPREFQGASPSLSTALSPQLPPPSYSPLPIHSPYSNRSPFSNRSPIPGHSPIPNRSPHPLPEKPPPPSSASRSTSHNRSEQPPRAAGKLRRGSHIYTSSEDEGSGPSPHTAHKEEPPKKRRKHIPRFHSRTLPSDRIGLRNYYKACFVIYIALYQEKVQRRDRIEKILAKNDSMSITVSDSEMDTDELDPEVVGGFIADLNAVIEEMEKIKKAWERLGGSVNSSGELLDS